MKKNTFFIVFSLYILICFSCKNQASLLDKKPSFLPLSDKKPLSSSPSSTPLIIKVETLPKGYVILERYHVIGNENALFNSFAFAFLLSMQKNKENLKAKLKVLLNIENLSAYEFLIDQILNLKIDKLSDFINKSKKWKECINLIKENLIEYIKTNRSKYEKMFFLQKEDKEDATDFDDYLNKFLSGDIWPTNYHIMIVALQDQFNQTIYLKKEAPYEKAPARILIQEETSKELLYLFQIGKNHFNFGLKQTTHLN